MLWICAIVIAGVLIGATGIGGVLVVPVLHDLRGIDFRASIAAASLAFGLPGLGAFWRMRSEGGAFSRGELALILATVPGAALGGWFVHAADTRLLLGMLGIATLGSGLWGLWGLRRPDVSARSQPLGRNWACAAGCAVGFGSAVTGTGGPAVLWPVMMAARQDLRSSLWIAQAIQLPIAVCASAIHMSAGGIDLALAAVVGAILVVGALVGHRAGMLMSQRLLRTAVCVLLIATGGFYLYGLMA
jgi:uncharacterized membrane protein YfcA